MKKEFIAICFILISCNNAKTTAKDAIEKRKINQESVIIHQNESILQKRFDTPNGYERTKIADNSFGAYLRKLPLKTFGSPVLYFDGTPKTKPNVYISVVNLSIGNKDLHQCADAVMNLWGNYLFAQKRYADIQFKFLGDNGWHNFKTWAGARSINYNLFFTYMQQVFSAANTRSLFAQLKPISITQLSIGDVLIVTGNPYGHAICVVDECINPITNKKLYMLAQSYMPAQETQILINPNDKNISPWYDLNTDDGIINTPEWQFTTQDCRRF